MITNDSKSYLEYLNKLVDEYNNTYHRSIGKKLIHADCSAFLICIWLLLFLIQNLENLRIRYHMLVVNQGNRL